MSKKHDKEIKDQFSKQAAGFSNKLLTLNQEDLLNWILVSLDFGKSMSVLDVAGGTGILSRSIAPYVHHVTSIDISQEMMNEGIKQTEQKGISNIAFRIGHAESLPFDKASFDLVVSRLGFHHFSNPSKILQEMRKVCVHNGTVSVIDMISPEDNELARLYNYYERLRDSSHLTALKRSQFVELFNTTGLEITQVDVVDVPVHLKRWLALTETDDHIKEQIIHDINTELKTGNIITGLSPYIKNGEMMFKQQWMKLIGKKTAEG